MMKARWRASLAAVAVLALVGAAQPALAQTGEDGTFRDDFDTLGSAWTSAAGDWQASDGAARVVTPGSTRGSVLALTELGLEPVSTATATFRTEGGGATAWAGFTVHRAGTTDDYTQSGLHRAGPQQRRARGDQGGRQLGRDVPGRDSDGGTAGDRLGHGDGSPGRRPAGRLAGRGGAAASLGDGLLVRRRRLLARRAPRPSDGRRLRRADRRRGARRAGTRGLHRVVGRARRGGRARTRPEQPGAHRRGRPSHGPRRRASGVRVRSAHGRRRRRDGAHAGTAGGLLRAVLLQQPHRPPGGARRTAERREHRLPARAGVPAHRRRELRLTRRRVHRRVDGHGRLRAHQRGLRAGVQLPLPRVRVRRRAAPRHAGVVGARESAHSPASLRRRRLRWPGRSSIA